jgi:transposase
METGLKKLQVAMDSGRLREEAVAHHRLGRLQGQNSRAAKAFDVTIERVKVNKKQKSARRPSDPDHSDRSGQRAHSHRPAKKKSKREPRKEFRLQISWKRNEAWHQWAQLSEGCYLLRSNLNATDPKTLWKHYIQLTDAEWAFRITKDELVLRPIWHQKEDRVRAHILVCFLAYVMWKALASWMRYSGLGDAPRSLLNELSKIKSADVVLPIQQARSSWSQTLHLRCVTEPDEEQKLFLHRLGLTLPKRLGSRLVQHQM